MVNEALAEMSDKKIPPDRMAAEFFKKNEKIWATWVSVPVAAKIKTGIK